MDDTTQNIVKEFLELQTNISERMESMMVLVAKHADSLDITADEKLWMQQDRNIQAVKSMTTRLGLSILEAISLSDMYRLKNSIVDDIRMILKRVN